MVGVLFVCLGNICRSPAAEGVFKDLVKKSNLQNKVRVDSAGTAAYHTGSLPDYRMRECALERGYELTSVARRFEEKDFDRFRFIVVMDQNNYRDIRSLARNPLDREKISLMTTYLENMRATHVPDPYYRGPEGFEQVLDIIENASFGLMAKVKEEVAKEEAHNRRNQ